VIVDCGCRRSTGRPDDRARPLEGIEWTADTAWGTAAPVRLVR
jgi:hypothetical protein